MLQFRRADRQAQMKMISRTQSEPQVQPVLSGSQAQARGLAALHNMVATTATVRRALSLPGLGTPPTPNPIQTSLPSTLHSSAADPDLEDRDIVARELTAYLQKREDQYISEGIDLYHYWSVSIAPSLTTFASITSVMLISSASGEQAHLSPPVPHCCRCSTCSGIRSHH